MGKRDDLASVMAHDLAEPLRVIAHYADRLPSDLDPEGRDAVDGIRAAARRMAMLVESLADYARAGGRRLERHPVDLDSVLDQALAHLKLALEETGVEVERSALPRLEADGIQLVRVFQNLIDNAIKFRSETRPCVRISAERDDAGWQLCVSDNGIGFDSDWTERVFELFERAHAQTDYSGTGAGLAICARIVENHGGRIWARSTVGGGSQFWFTLPD